VTFKVDMSFEHDNGYFKPEDGDKISIAGNFNNWKADSLFLSDENQDYIFEINLQNLPDTLEFKIKQQSGDGRPLANSGWEGIANRKIAKSNLLKNQYSVFRYNELWEPDSTYEVTFTVGMSNQIVLGFFRPEEGDQVVVSGDFLKWNEDGILLSDQDGDEIYSVSVPVKMSEDNPLEYKFRMVSKQSRPVLNSGWETTENRKFYYSEYLKNGSELTNSEDNTVAEIELPYADFSEQSRIARFIINTTEFEKVGKFAPLKGDFLQIKLEMDGKETLSDPLINVGKKKWETALIIPLTVRIIKWSIFLNNTKSISNPELVKINKTGSQIVY